MDPTTSTQLPKRSLAEQKIEKKKKKKFAFTFSFTFHPLTESNCKANNKEKQLRQSQKPWKAKKASALATSHDQVDTLMASEQ